MALTSDRRLEDIHQRGQQAFRRGKSLPLQFREGQLRALQCLISENLSLLEDALNADFRKNKYEANMCEISVLQNELLLFLHKFWDWAKPEKPSKGLSNFLDTVQVRKDPYGLVLVIGSWNYPFFSLLKPFIGAVAAGNCVILRPSDVAQNAGKVIADLIPKYMDAECYQIFQGGDSDIVHLLQHRFDYIFFTGSPNAGKLVQKAASHNLTPVTLVLGGKCPVYLDDNANIENSARRIIWGKILNAGQTCIAPDYLLCSKSVEEKFIVACKKAVAQFLGTTPKTSCNYVRIINDAHYERLVRLLANTEIALGGNCDHLERFIEPTILSNVQLDDAIMQEEIFGPILPIVNVDNVDDAIEIINAREKPRALYIFSENKATVKKFLQCTSSGGVCVNDVINQITTANTPFGGVGHSGMGSFGGKYSFDTFTHQKTCLIRDLSGVVEKLTSIRYPPYSESKIRLLNFVLHQRTYPPLGWLKNYLIFFLGVAVAAAYYYYSK